VISHILMPTDFSWASQAALEMAVDLARRFGARLTLFHAHQVPSYVFPDGVMPVQSQMLMELERTVVAELTRLAAPIAAQGLKVETRHTLGAPAAEICRAAEELGADLVVMGTHGRSGLGHFLLGSVAEKVLRRAHCPVLTIHGHEEAVQTT
jgi:nucleotide-binding universal stress UspA family protein